MSLIEQINKTRSEFRKSPDQAVGFSILTLLVGELETVSKRDGSETTDEKVVSGIKKLIKSNNETIRLGHHSEKLEKENEVLSSFLPAEMSEDQIGELIRASGAKNIGEAMKLLNSGYAGQFDRGLASKVAKQLFG